MTLQTLVSVVNENTKMLAEKMHLETDAIIINQCDTNTYEQYDFNGHTIKCYSFAEIGVGLSRNNALLRATADIILFSDEDIVFRDNYEEKILQEFQQHPQADMIVFNFDVNEERRTYYNKEWKRVHLFNCGRYPTFSFAIRTEKMHKKNITYSLLFGGGAKYSNGEDSLFIRECIKKGLQVYASPQVIGKEEGRPSTWFHGYNEKFFFDRGVLYHYLYGHLAYVLAIRFLLKHRNQMCKEIPCKEALKLMKKGIADARI